jgi:hypothetical protein
VTILFIPKTVFYHLGGNGLNQYTAVGPTHWRPSEEEHKVFLDSQLLRRLWEVDTQGRTLVELFTV